MKYTQRNPHLEDPADTPLKADCPSTAGPALDLAIRFHETYERLAPQFGYETRLDTRAFDPTSKNGKLMVAVCAEILEHNEARKAAEHYRNLYYLPTDGLEAAKNHPLPWESPLDSLHNAGLSHGDESATPTTHKS